MLAGQVHLILGFLGLTGGFPAGSVAMVSGGCLVPTGAVMRPGLQRSGWIRASG